MNELQWFELGMAVGAVVMLAVFMGLIRLLSKKDKKEEQSTKQV